MELKEKIKNLPLSPGVYLMKNSLGDIIYVGKSKSLKKRVQSYFYNSKIHPPKIERLVKSIKDFEYITTDTEFEAFMLECRLIKELKPMYNKKMKNPHSYTYIEIQINEGYGGIKTTHSPYENNSHLYFGPYTSKNTVERAIQGIKECCKILCSNSTKKNTSCLNYSLGLCIGMCIGDSVTEEYHNIVNKIIALLNGTDMSILEEMKQKMKYASEKFDFEVAAKYRDYIDAVISLINKERAIEFTEENRRFTVIEYLNVYTIKLFLIKGNSVLFSKKYTLDSTDIEQLNRTIRTNILTYFNTKELNSQIKISKDEIDEAQIIYSYLKSSTCDYVVIPEKWLNSENNIHLIEALNKLLQSQK